MTAREKSEAEWEEKHSTAMLALKEENADLIKKFQEVSLAATPEDDRLEKLMQIALQGPGSSSEDEGVEITPLCDGGEVGNGGEKRENQRSHWLILHTGRKQLMSVLFQRISGASYVDVIVSLKDDDSGTTYTSYIHTNIKTRSSALKKSLRHARGISAFRVIGISRLEMKYNNHFQKIAEGVKSAHKNLKIDMPQMDPKSWNDMIQMFLC